MTGIYKPGVARANIAVSTDLPNGTPGHAEKFRDYSVLQQHVLFWDRDEDGVIWPQHTYRGFRSLGFNVLFSIFAMVVIHGGFSYPTRLGYTWMPDPFFRVFVGSVHKAKHASDSAVYDNEGRFVPQNFENLFSKFGNWDEGTLSSYQLRDLMKGNRCAADLYGAFAAFFEWGTTWLLLQKDGNVHKEDLRRVYDGSIFWIIEAERKKGRGWNQGFGLGGDGFWGSTKRRTPVRLTGTLGVLYRLVGLLVSGFVVSVICLYVYDRTLTPRTPDSGSEPPTALRSAWYPRQCQPHSGPVHRPNSTKEVESIVKAALEDCPLVLGERIGSNQLNVRASRQLYHSSTKFPCVNINAGKCAIQLDMSRMHRIISWDTSDMTITVEPSIQMNHLMDTMHELGMSMQLQYIPIYTALSVGGMLLTGAHGSSVERPTAFGHLVSELEYVDSNGEARREVNPTRWIGSLGMYGIVTQMTLHATTPYKLNTTVAKENDANLPERIATLVREPAFSRIVWYPNAHTAIIRWHSATTPDAPGDAYHSFFEHRPWAAVGGKIGLMVDQLNFSPIPTDWAICFFEKHLPPFWYKEGSTGIWLGFNESVFGWPHKLGGSSCEGSQLGCYWQNQVQILVEFDMDVRLLGRWILEVRSITDSIRFHGCLPSLLGFAMRFGKASTAPLDMAYGRDTVYIDMLVAKGVPGLPANHQDVLDEIEQITFGKYGARPHWGKNPERVFLNPSYPVRDKYPEFNKHLEMALSADPRGIFEPSLFSRVKDREHYSTYPGCAVRMDCYCSKDEHCGSPLLYRCDDSLHSVNASVCRKRF